MQFHDVQEPMIMAPKSVTMNVHLNLTNMYTTAWNKNRTDYSDPL